MNSFLNKAVLFCIWAQAFNSNFSHNKYGHDIQVASYLKGFMIGR